MLSTLGERMSKSNAGQGSESTSNVRSTVAAGKRRQSRGMRGQRDGKMKEKKKALMALFE